MSYALSVSGRAWWERFTWSLFDLMNSMDGVLGMVERLLDTDLTQEQLKFAKPIQNSGGTLLAIINDILDFSKIEAGKLTLEAIDFDLQLLLDEVAQRLAPNARAKRLELAVIIAGETKVFLKGDPTRLRQVLINLVGNAVKFTHTGEVIIQASTSPIANDRVMLHLSIRDSGIGISQQALSSLFSPFSKADCSTTRNYGGTGLGLTISKEIVLLMQGELTCESENGKGSTFSFSVPLEKATGQRNTPGPLGRPPPRFNIDVLVAEDNYTNQEVALHNLRKFGCRVDMVSNGKEAVDAVVSKNYDLVFMDCQMPVMDGYRASAEIRRREKELAREHTVTIIAATANAVKDDKKRCLAAGMDDYMSKPFHKSQLLSVLERWCEIGSPETTVQEPKEEPWQPTAPNAQGPIDTRVLQELRKLQIKGEPDIIQHIVNAYLITSKQLIAKMKQALSTEDFFSLQQSAHSLKSSSANLGAMELSEMNRQLELISKQDAMASAAHLIQTIEQEACKVNIALRKEACPHDP